MQTILFSNDEDYHTSCHDPIAPMKFKRILSVSCPISVIATYSNILMRLQIRRRWEMFLLYSVDEFCEFVIDLGFLQSLDQSILWRCFSKRGIYSHIGPWPAIAIFIIPQWNTESPAGEDGEAKCYQQLIESSRSMWFCYLIFSRKKNDQSKWLIHIL